MTDQVEQIRSCIWANFIEPAIERGDSRIAFDWAIVARTVKAVGLGVQPAAIQNALESWDDRRIISVKWMGVRRGQEKSIDYVVEVTAKTVEDASFRDSE